MDWIVFGHCKQREVVRSRHTQALAVWQAGTCIIGDRSVFLSAISVYSTLQHPWLECASNLSRVNDLPQQARAFPAQRPLQVPSLNNPDSS